MTSPFTTEQRAALCQLIDAWADKKVVLIGAAALGCHVSMTWRRTNDIDLTVVADVARVSAELRALEFMRDPKREHRWFSKDGVVLDVLPVTRDAIDRRELVWPESGFTMQLPAFDLLLVHTMKYEIDSAHSIEIATVPTIVVLKMAAWLDQPYERTRDLQDIGYILSAYLGDDDDRRWDDPRLEGIAFDLQGAHALAHDIAQIMEPHHRQIVQRFLGNFADTGTHAFALLASAGVGAAHDREGTLLARIDALSRVLATS